MFNLIVGFLIALSIYGLCYLIEFLRTKSRK